MLLIGIYSLVYMIGTVMADSNHPYESESMGFFSAISSAENIPNKLRGSEFYGEIGSKDVCPAIGGIKQYPAHFYKDHRISFCTPSCLEGPCPNGPAKNKPRCSNPPGLCVILCDKNTDCQEGAICFNTGIAGVCAFNTTSA
ncbi:hypothetical protein FOL47_006919 [Perkinsus chesapeaki]|uniref:Uncharacterized protein n=1 Tax=Perkinsus chesapeaki TaxID=330153 RepID=A0A7J6LPC3_PERCH|nr:hypothetical protein FOL47_006919 [Perkinsus chesapeaki]